MMGAPQPARSPSRAAGCPPISTVGQPGGRTALGGCGGTPGNVQACGVPTVAAGFPPFYQFGLLKAMKDLIDERLLTARPKKFH